MTAECEIAGDGRPSRDARISHVVVFSPEHVGARWVPTGEAEAMLHGGTRRTASVRVRERLGLAS